MSDHRLYLASALPAVVALLLSGCTLDELPSRDLLPDIDASVLDEDAGGDETDGEVASEDAGADQDAEPSDQDAAVAATYGLFAADDGIALVSVPGREVLKQEVPIRTDRKEVFAWQAKADQTWLTVTTSGMTGEPLTLEAKLDGLPADTLQLATITLSTAEPGIEYTDSIHVGLWIGAKTPADKVQVQTTFTHVVTDPIRPYAYAHGDGADISVYNIYSGAPVGKIERVAPQLGHMAVSSDGATLFVVDATNYVIKRIALDTLEVDNPMWKVVSKNAQLAYTKLNGGPLLVTGEGSVLNSTDGTQYTTQLGTGEQAPALSLDGARACMLDLLGVPYTLRCYRLAHSFRGGSVPSIVGLATLAGPATSTDSMDAGSMDAGSVDAGTGDLDGGTDAEGGQLSEAGQAAEAGQVAQDAGATGTTSSGPRGLDVALSADGERVYVVASDTTVYDGYDTATLTTIVQSLPGPDTAPNNIETSAGKQIVYGLPTVTGGGDVWFFDDQGFDVGHREVALAGSSLLDAQLRISGDEQRIVALTDGPSLWFVSAP